MCECKNVTHLDLLMIAARPAPRRPEQWPREQAVIFSGAAVELGQDRRDAPPEAAVVTGGRRRVRRLRRRGEGNRCDEENPDGTKLAEDVEEPAVEIWTGAMNYCSLLLKLGGRVLWHQ